MKKYVPETMKKYSFNLNQLLGLRAQYEKDIKELDKPFGSETFIEGNVFANVIQKNKIAELNFQIKMIDKLLAAS